MPKMTSGYERERDDFYPSPPGVIESLFRFVPFGDGRIWEPAAGDGALVDQIRAAGRECVGTDLVDRGRADIEPRVDFLFERAPLASSIITNPPYKLADQFIRHAIDIGVDRVALLLPVKWLAGTGPRWELTRHVTDVVLMGRLKMLPPGAIDLGKNPTTDFAWIVFRREHDRAPVIRFHNARGEQ